MKSVALMLLPDKQRLKERVYGRQYNWAAAAKRMEADHSMSREDARNLRWHSVFGDLIANTDQHFGNISLAGNAGRYRLLPFAILELPKTAMPSCV